MNDKIQNSTFNKILNKVRDNLRIIIYFFTFFLILFIIFQFYTYYQNQKILNLSIVYDEAKNNVDSEQYFENMLKISEKDAAVHYRESETRARALRGKFEPR